ncbi:hypothetical protein ACHHYP_16754 [Achlya hypogyna]|uniref:GAF domain-containing protein n=1 Tax=Achlya hypogyna TaxID=1202772 RepID=A0A1V9Y5Y8_ACHHY|nr:hypothetical protein ACHHYP_16754 [Achlya hypogyna]
MTSYLTIVKDWAPVAAAVAAADKPVVALFGASWCAVKTKKVVAANEAVLAGRDDVALFYVDVDAMDEDDVMDLGVGELPFFQVYAKGDLLEGFKATDDDATAKKVVRHVGWNGAAPTHDPADALPAVDYDALFAVVDKYTKGETDFIANTANVAAAIWHAFATAGRPINWSGFYFNRPTSSEASTPTELDKRLLVLGPFQGKPACKRIKFHSGVCGAAASTRAIQVLDGHSGIANRIPDVHLFPGHIACDDASQSEIVLPILHNGVVLGVLDLDCPHKHGFQQRDADGLGRILELFVPRTEWTVLSLPIKTA